MQQAEIIEKIKSNLEQLPLSFRYLGALQEQAQSSNYNVVQYKPATVHALQTNDEMVGVYHKPLSRMIQPVGSTAPVFADDDPGYQEEHPVKILPDQYFRLFATCIPVKGAARSLICDLQRQYFHFIPNALYDILTDDPVPFEQLAAPFDAEEVEMLKTYFHFLLEKEYGFWCTEEELSLFPPLSMEWDNPLPVTNCIIDYDRYSDFDCKDILQQLDAIGCAALQLRFFSPQSLLVLEDLLKSLDGSRIKTVDLYLPYTVELTPEKLTGFVQTYQRLNNVVVFSASESRFLNDIHSQLSRIIYTTEAINSETHCGVVNPDYFMVNGELFTESIHHNNCLNRKIAVDKKGIIKNCPSMQRGFGHISNTSLAEALHTDGFKDKWNITKDEVEVCRDCEFRYICTDCRVYSEPAPGQLGKPSKCTYNPYTATWD
jgi:SPASM domain peptide maturase of grasp-with-spasm system